MERRAPSRCGVSDQHWCCRRTFLGLRPRPVCRGSDYYELLTVPFLYVALCLNILLLFWPKFWSCYLLPGDAWKSLHVSSQHLNISFPQWEADPEDNKESVDVRLSQGCEQLHWKPRRTVPAKGALLCPPLRGGGGSELRELEMENDTQHGSFCTFNRGHCSWGVLSKKAYNTLTRIRCFGEGIGCPSHHPALKYPWGMAQAPRSSTEQGPADLYHWV